MTDVEAGGSTVFLDAETVIEPQKVFLSTFCYYRRQYRTAV